MIRDDSSTEVGAGRLSRSENRPTAEAPTGYKRQYGDAALGRQGKACSVPSHTVLGLTSAVIEPERILVFIQL